MLVLKHFYTLSKLIFIFIGINVTFFLIQLSINTKKPIYMDVFFCKYNIFWYLLMYGNGLLGRKK